MSKQETIIFAEIILVLFLAKIFIAIIFNSLALTAESILSLIFAIKFFSEKFVTREEILSRVETFTFYSQISFGVIFILWSAWNLYQLQIPYLSIAPTTILLLSTIFQLLKIQKTHWHIFFWPTLEYSCAMLPFTLAALAGSTLALFGFWQGDSIAMLVIGAEIWRRYLHPKLAEKKNSEHA